MPHLSNCEHDGNGWCLDCVRRIIAERDAARAEVERLQVAIAEHRKQTGDASADNVMYLLRNIRLIHDSLCPDKFGVWTREVEQAVEAAVKAGKTIAKLPRYANGEAFVPGVDEAWMMTLCGARKVESTKLVGSKYKFTSWAWDSDCAYPTEGECKKAMANHD